MGIALANYEYTMDFWPTHKHNNADALSRLPTESVEIEEPVPTEFVNLMEAMDKMPITTETRSMDTEIPFTSQSIQVCSVWVAGTLFSRLEVI